MESVNALWYESERRRPDHVALIQGPLSWTYRELGAEIRAISGMLTGRGSLASGEIVALLAPNVMEFVASYFGILRAGGAVQPIDPRLTPKQRQLRVQESRARILLVHERFASNHGLTGPSSEPQEVVVVGNGTLPPEDTQRPHLHGAAVPDAAAARNTIAELMYTSGTTGESKIVLRSHGNVLAAARNSIRGFGYAESDVIGIAMPLSHSSALNSQLLPLLQLGGTVLLIDQFDEAVLRGLLEHRVTCMRLVPSMLNMLLSHDGFQGDRLPAMRLLINSSAPVQPAKLTALKQRFPRVEVMDSYGLTEASTCTVLTVDPLQEHAGDVGRAIDGVQIDVVDVAGRPVETGTEGEVRVRGDHVFMGYLDKPRETAEALRDGWLWTGDLGRIEKGGELYLHGRKSEVIQCSGFKIHPLVVERCIKDLPGIEGAVVVGMPHKFLGEVVRAFVVLRDPALTSREIIHHCSRELSSYEVPFRVDIVDTLPLGVTGKVRRQDLKERQP